MCFYKRTYFFLIIFEIIQQISYVFTDSLYDKWKISNKDSGKFKKK